MASLLSLLLAHPVATARTACVLGVLLGGFVAACLTEADLRADVRAALERARWTLEAAAAQIGISRQRLGHQLNGTDRLTCLTRLALLEGFWPALIDISAGRSGQLVIHNAELAEILTFLKGNKVMARMTMPAQKARETA